MRNFIKKYYIQLITVFILFVVTIVMFLQSFNVKNMIKNKSQELQQMQLDYVLAQKFLNNEYEFKKDSVYIKNNSSWLSIFLPNDDDEKVRLFAILEELAKKTGNNSITLSVVNSVPKIKEKKAIKTKKRVINDTMNIKVSLIGNYNDLIYFLQKLENMKYFTEVTSINVSKIIRNIPFAEKGNKEEIRKDLLQTDMNITFYLDK